MNSKGTVLLSIKPEYVRNIESGEKKYEFRRAVFSEMPVPLYTTYIGSHPHTVRHPKATPVLIFIYESAPTKAITGYFYCGEIITNSPQKLWGLFSGEAGISEEEFFRYFRRPRYVNSPYKTGHALKISGFAKLDSPVSLSEIGLNRAPQNFQYLFHSMVAGLEPLKGKYEVWEDTNGYLTSWANVIDAYKECDRLHDVDGHHYFVKENL